MSKSDGKSTKDKILEAAELLFSEKGYDAGAMDAIAREVGINKASIYYHFKSKEEILSSLVDKLLEEIRLHVQANAPSPVHDIRSKLKAELNYMRNKKQILTVIMMEALKSGKGYQAFFDCANETARAEAMAKGLPIVYQTAEYYSFEFFTGFMPMVSYIVFEYKWAAYMGMDLPEAEDIFLNNFIDTHLKAHSQINAGQ